MKTLWSSDDGFVAIRQQNAVRCPVVLVVGADDHEPTLYGLTAVQAAEMAAALLTSITKESVLASGSND